MAYLYNGGIRVRRQHHLSMTRTIPLENNGQCRVSSTESSAVQAEEVREPISDKSRGSSVKQG